MACSRIALLAIGVVLLTQAAAGAATPIPEGAPPVPAVPVCNGKFKGGLRPSPDELADILEKHHEWELVGGWWGDPKLANDPRRANLCGADLTNANLTNASLTSASLTSAHLEGAHLTHADLHGADLGGADLNNADLGGANLEGAHLEGAHLYDAHLNNADLSNAHLYYAHLNSAHLDSADLTGAHLDGADLYNAHLDSADLTGAHLDGADLHGADLHGADLGGAHLTNADLGGVDLGGAHLYDAHLVGADLSSANVADTDFDFDPDSPPKAVPGIYTARNLQLVKFSIQPAGLVKLRGEFKDLGLRTQESQLTYAIRRSELSHKDPHGHYVHSWSERTMSTVFFDWTCQYGMSPGRPLLIAAALVVMLSMVYIFAQVNPGPNGGIWAIWDEHRIKQDDGSSKPQQLTEGFPSRHSRINIFLLALYFSLLSATRIGWRELNVGTWITRIQPRQYSLQATGWVRVVSGIQSLISVYLVALAILTYFGTPFEY